MAIPESQLETWSHQGSKIQSSATYATISGVLNDINSPYYPKLFDTFLQGSYGNDTNVYRDSDVDVVIRLNNTWYNETDALEEGAKATFDRTRSPATYGYTEFRAEVLAWLVQKYGADVHPGTKAITLKATSYRREADVLPCTKFRRYRADSNGNDDKYDEGICFFKTDGTRITNFPKQHADNCTSKHQNTNNKFKPIVRIFKNMRNRMVDDGFIADGLAPSYFLEGMLWNVPSVKFGSSYGDTVVDAVNWLSQTDKTNLACANDLFWLVRDNSPVCWSTASFDAYLTALAKFWNQWS